jgi:putative hydrolase of the HAD superfamily
MNISLSQIRNILFDWGGVLTPLDMDGLKNAFQLLSNSSIENSIKVLFQQNFFHTLESGEIDEKQFVAEIRKYLKESVSDIEIEQAWDSILGPTKPEVIHLLKQLKNRYNIFLLSNTNSIHVRYYTKYLKDTYGINGWKDIFQQTYYSYKLGCLKPSHEIFNKVIHHSGIKAAETLFIDDSKEHINTAKELNFHTFHITNVSILDIFNPPSRSASEDEKCD